MASTRKALACILLYAACNQQMRQFAHEEMGRDPLPYPPIVSILATLRMTDSGRTDVANVSNCIISELFMSNILKCASGDLSSARNKPGSPAPHRSSSLAYIG